VEPDDLGDQMAALTPNLRAFAWALTRDPDEVEDLVQETFTRALGARSRFEPGTNLRAWLFTILRNLHLNRRRAAAVETRVISIEQLSLDRTPSRLDDVEARAVARTSVAAISRAFRMLPPDYAAPLHLAAVEDLSYSQIAALLGIPKGTVMSRVFRARRMLIRLLAEEQL